MLDGCRERDSNPIPIVAVIGRICLCKIRAGNRTGADYDYEIIVTEM